MKAIKIDVKNFEKLEAALLAANGKATTHTYNTAAQLQTLAEYAEKECERLGLNKSDRCAVL